MFIPRNGGSIKNGKPSGYGDLINQKQMFVKSGNFDINGELTGKHCYLIDYSGVFVSVRVGEYSSDKPNGEIKEYVFSKTKWKVFFNGGVDCVKYLQVFNNGSWKATIGNELKKIKANVTYSDINVDEITSFSFSEVNNEIEA